MENRPLTYEPSYWEQASFWEGIDVAVVGSGIVGLSAALAVRERTPSARVVVLERGPLPIGASTRNAGFACFGSMTELQRLRQRLGDRALRYEGLGGYELFRPEDRAAHEECLDHLAAFNRRMKSITGLADTYRRADDRLPGFGFRGVDHLILNAAEGQLHTGEMMRTLLAQARAAGVEVFTGLGVDQVEDDGRQVRLLTDRGWALRAGRVLVATNGFARQLLPELDVVPARNQVLITRPVPGLSLAGSFHYDRGYYYFRNIDGRLLLGGGRSLAQEAETTDRFGTTPLIRAALERLLREVILPERTAEVEYWWSGILGVGQRKTPVIRRLGPNLAAAVRLGGMGVAIGCLVGEAGAELLMEAESTAPQG